MQNSVGSMARISLPEYEPSPNLFHERLGVWNIECAPIVYVDMYGYSYFYKQSADKSKSVGNQAKFKYYLSPVNIVINPAIAEDFTITNFKQDFAIDDYAASYSIEFWNTEKSEPYGALGSKTLYRPINGYIECSDDMLRGMRRDFDDVAFFSDRWNAGLEAAKKLMYCRVCFDLVSKKDGSVYSFSKYFNVNPVKRNYTHENVEI